MDGQPGQEDGEGAGRDRDPEPTPPASGTPVPNPAPPGPDPRLAQFAWDDSREGPAPSGRMALLVDELSGPERRCPGATGDELVGLLRAWAAIESWAAGAKLGVIREIMRREGPAVARQRPRRPAGELVPVAALRAIGRAGLLDPVGREHRVARVAAGGAAAPHRRPAG